VKERDGNNNPTVAYTRGLDLSGTLEGAGGVGGMLARSSGYSGGSWGTRDYYYTDGRGNITRVVNTTLGTVANYQFDPYGRMFSGSDSIANVYRFSSKRQHINSGMYYYGYRFYVPWQQRWLNRDPDQEWGGVNLYGYVGNNPVRFVDLYGLSWGNWWDPRTWFNGGFTGSLGDQVGSIGNTLGDLFTGNGGNLGNNYDNSTLGQAAAAGPKTHAATEVCLATAGVATTADAATGGVEYFFLENQPAAEFNLFSRGNVFKAISRPLGRGFRIDPAHHGKSWGHMHWWGFSMLPHLTCFRVRCR
jgi:RHS repeat-associated protein